MARILVVDDKAALRQTLELMLQEEGHVTAMAEDIAGVKAALLSQPLDLVLTDLRLGAETGLDVIGLVKQADPTVEVVLMTAYGSVDSAVEAMKLGAYDYVLKPFDAEQLKKIVARALERRSLSHEIATLRAALKNQGSTLIVGTDPALLDVLNTLRQVAPTEAPVLILGESGTGKELLAKFLHQHSRRAQGPLVALNCAAMPESLLESELFGSVKGAFTDASRDRTGLLEEANTGTFFMDEVGETTPMLQAKLLRVLQERQVRRLGENKSRPVDFRLVCATHQDINRLLQDGRMREDFLFRINVIAVRVPPLRERAQDIPLLANHFLNRQIKALGREGLHFSEAAMVRLMAHPWPGNVRELANTVERAAVLSMGDELGPELLGLALSGGSSAYVGVAQGAGPASGTAALPVVGVDFNALPTMEEVEGKYLSWLFDEKKLSLSEAEKITQLSLSTLKRRKRQSKRG